MNNLDWERKGFTIAVCAFIMGFAIGGFFVALSPDPEPEIQYVEVECECTLDQLHDVQGQLREAQDQWEFCSHDRDQVFHSFQNCADELFLIRAQNEGFRQCYMTFRSSESSDPWVVCQHNLPE